MTQPSRPEIDKLIQELKEQGIDHRDHETDDQDKKTGLGDVIEASLTKLGITQETFRSMLGLRECSCTERKRWLNNILSWKKRH